jgi:hypothetical protein
MPKEETLVDRVAGWPWALFILFGIGLFGLYLVATESPKLSMGEYMGALAAASGLHGIGHGIRMHARRGSTTD